MIELTHWAYASLIVRNILSQELHVYVVGSSTRETYADVVDIESRIFGGTTSSSFALWDAKSLAKIGETLQTLIYEFCCDYVEFFERHLCQNKS